MSILQGDDILPALIATLYRIPAVLIALTLHEIAHGYVALRCGDPTAQMLGRLSLNPLKHLDPIGTLFMILFGFGWAKPVPVVSRNFKHFRRDDLLVSIAGVSVNFILFFITTLVMVGVNQLIWKPELWDAASWSLEQRFSIQYNGLSTAVQPSDFLRFGGNNFSSIFAGSNQLVFTEIGVQADSIGYYIPGMFDEFVRFPMLLYIQRFLMNFSMINLGLCIFNLLPIPPLDGYHVVNHIFLRGKLHIPYKVIQFCSIGLMVLMFATSIISDAIGKALYFVQNGVVYGILAVLGLG